MLAPSVIAAQPTAVGRQIHRVTFDGDALIPGYGDYGANKGPIHLLRMALADQAVTDEATLTTEQIWRTVPSGLGTLCPFMDPRGGIGDPEYGSYAVRQTDGSWTTYSIDTPYAIHVFGMAEHDGALYAAGAAQIGDLTSANVWQSLDGGSTWSTSLTLDDPTGNDQRRFYDLFVLRGDLFALEVNAPEASRAVYRLHAGSWDVVVPSALGALDDAVVWSEGGVPFALCLYGKAPAFSIHSWAEVVVHPDDASERDSIQAGVTAVGLLLDAQPSRTGSHLYALKDDGDVVRHDGTSWSTVLRVDPDKKTSLAADDVTGFLYFGTTNGKVVRCPLPD